MRLILSLLLLTTFLACGKKSGENQGFPQGVDKLQGVDYEDPLWLAVRTLLEIPALDGSSLEALGVSLGTPSTLISDAAKAAAESQAQVALHLTEAPKTRCATIKAPLVDLNPGAAVGLSNAFSVKNGTPTALGLPAKVYWMQYKLGEDEEFRSALVTVPTTDPTTANGIAAAIQQTVALKSESDQGFGYPLVIYAHAAAGGLAYEELAQSLGDLQSGHIIAAPVFPGEPLCVTYDTVNGKKTTTCTGDNIVTGGEPPLGTESEPYQSDVNDLLGLHDCMKTFTRDTDGIATVNLQGTVGIENISNKFLKISENVRLAAVAANNAGLAVAASSPVTMAVGLGRGAGVVNLALSRAGGINSVLLSTSTDATTVAAQTALSTAGISPYLYSCSAVLSPQATFSAGKNRIFLDYWVRNDSGLLNPAQQQASDAIPGFASIHNFIAAVRDTSTLSVTEKSENIAAFVKGIDSTFQVPLLHGGVQNFGKAFKAVVLKLQNNPAAATTAAAAQGAAMILHGSKDSVADISSTQLFSNIATGVSAALASQNLSAGINWLALSVTPPDALVDATGALAADDLGHVGDASFLEGTTAVDANISSNIATAAFVDKTPEAAIATWLFSQCYAAVNADPI